MAISDEQKKHFTDAEAQLKIASEKLQEAVNMLGGMTKIKAGKDGRINSLPVKVVLTDSAKMIISFRDISEAEQFYNSI